MAEIQFSRGVPEPVVPEVRLTRSKDGTNGRAFFRFEKPDALMKQEAASDIAGMFMLDEEGELSTTDVNGKFINGEPVAIEATYSIKSPEAWERFIRFMNRYAEKNGLGLTKAKE